MAADQGTDQGSGPRLVCYTTDTGETRMLVPILLVCGDLYSYIIPIFSVITEAGTGCGSENNLFHCGSRDISLQGRLVGE